MRKHRVHLSALVVALLATAAPTAAGSTDLLRPTAEGDGRSMFYFVGAHPDDEIVTWQLVDEFQEHYPVFVTVTRGERGASCLTAEQAKSYPHSGRDDVVSGATAWGPYAYEGPGSPVGERDEGERRPFGDPWVGQGTRACGDAKLASWHWFLDAMAGIGTNRTRLREGSGLPDFGIGADPVGDPYADDDYQGRFCRGYIPSPDGRGAGCVDVWADDVGARVAFDLGDGGWPPGGGPPYRDAHPFTEADVVAAVEALRRNRDRWGISELPEAGILATASACDPDEADRDDVKATDDGWHIDHETVNDAVYGHDFGMGRQYGAVCDGTQQLFPDGNAPVGDHRFRDHPGIAQQPDPDTWWQLNAVEPQPGPEPDAPRESGWNRRVGPVQVNYGWIANGQPWDLPVWKAWQRYGE